MNMHEKKKILKYQVIHKQNVYNTESKRYRRSKKRDWDVNTVKRYQS